MTVAIAFKIHQSLFSSPESTYFGALDMGGASKQIAFILRNDIDVGTMNQIQCKADWFLRFQGIDKNTSFI